MFLSDTDLSSSLSVCSDHDPREGALKDFRSKRPGRTRRLDLQETEINV